MCAIAFIFGMTLMDGDASYGTSEAVTLRFLSFFGKEPEVISEVEKAEAIDGTHSLIRTLAHIAEYMFLSLTLQIMITTYGFRRRIRFVYALLLGVCVSLVDEFMQIFVPGRYCDLKDVVCDFLGIFTVAFLFLWIGRGRARKKQADKYKLPSCRREFMSFPIDNLTFDEAVSHIMELSQRGNCAYIVTPNADHAVKLEKDKELRALYKEATLIVPDGTPLLWTADSLGKPLKDRITGADLLPAICKEAARQGRSIFLLGGEEGVALAAKDNLRKEYRGLKIAGTYAPQISLEKDDAEIRKTISIINNAKPDILVVSLGCPKQEKFIYRYQKELKAHVALPIGAALDFAAGKVKRAPKWMQKAGMEWLYRFICEPGRLFRRYFVDDMKVFLLAFKYRKKISTGREIERPW